MGRNASVSAKEALAAQLNELSMNSLHFHLMQAVSRWYCVRARGEGTLRLVRGSLEGSGRS